MASEFVRSLVFSVLDHSSNDAKTPYQIVNSRFEEWKQKRMAIAGEDQKAEEEYIIKYGSKRAEQEEAYQQWHTLRSEKMKSTKNTNVIGKQEKLIKELSSIPLPEVLTTQIPDIYTKYKPNQ